MTNKLNRPNPKPTKKQVQLLLAGLKAEAAKAGMPVDLEVLDEHLRVGLESPAHLLTFVTAATSAGPLNLHGDLFIPLEKLADVITRFVALNSAGAKAPPPAAT